MTEPAQQLPAWVSVLVGLFSALGGGTAVAAVWRMWTGQRVRRETEERKERAQARQDLLDAEERRTADHRGDLDRQRDQYEAQLAAEREQHQREIERLSAAFEAHYLTLRDIPIRQDKIVQEAVEMAQRLASAVPVASGAPQREPRRRAAP